jgi:serine/threonine-protein kinase RsbW
MRQPVKSLIPRPGRGSHVVELRIPPSAEWVGVARLAIAGIANRMQFSIEDIEDLKLAVAEACNSYIQSASDSDEVCIASEIRDDRLVITVDALQNLEGHPPGKLPGDSVTSVTGGLGNFLIRSLMDEVSYEHDPQTGTKLVMSKLLRK